MNEVTVLAVAAAPQVGIVRVEFSNAPALELKLKDLNDVQRRIAHVRSLRFGAVSFSGQRCMARVVALSLDGRELFESSAEECADGLPARVAT